MALFESIIACSFLSSILLLSSQSLHIPLASLFALSTMSPTLSSSPSQCLSNASSAFLATVFASSSHSLAFFFAAAASPASLTSTPS